MRKLTYKWSRRDLSTGESRQVAREGSAWPDLGLLVGGRVVASSGYSLQVEKDGKTYIYDVSGYEFDADVLELE